MESRVEIGNTADTGPSFSPSCSAEHNVTTCPRVRGDPGCFMMRVSHGGQHYGVSITNRMIHRGCRHGNEETMCDQIRSHLGPLTVGEVFCKVELCEGDLCNGGDWGEEEEVREEGGKKDGNEEESGGNNGGEVEKRKDPGQTGRNNGIAAAQTNFEAEKVDEMTEKKKMNKKKRGKNKKGGKNKKTKKKKRRKVKPAKLSKRRKLN